MNGRPFGVAFTDVQQAIGILIGEAGEQKGLDQRDDPRRSTRTKGQPWATFVTVASEAESRIEVTGV
jgi:hypothetical protein